MEIGPWPVKQIKGGFREFSAIFLMDNEAAASSPCFRGKEKTGKDISPLKKTDLDERNGRANIFLTRNYSRCSEG